MVQPDPNAPVTNTPNNSHLQSSRFANSFTIYVPSTDPNAAPVPYGHRNGVSSSTPSPRNLHNPNLHAFPNSFKADAASNKNSHSTLHQSKSYSVFPSSLIDQPDEIAPPIDGRKSTPPPSWDRDSSVDCSLTVNSSSSSSSSSGPSESRAPKKSYLDVALLPSNKQEPNRKSPLPNGFSRNSSSNLAAPQLPSSPSSSSTGSSSLQSQLSKDQTSYKSTAPVVTQSGSHPEPPARSITFGTFDLSVVRRSASVSFRHLDTFTRLSRTSTSNKHLSVSTSRTTTIVAAPASYPQVSASDPLGKETDAPSSKDALKVPEHMSGHVLERCQSCNNHLKHCCRETIIDILSRSRSS
uniref:Uncharacterized protein n=1 Tax=Rhizophora mucronata TaxID=61149 RepID=A0A2P2MYK7_RHIMU